MGVFQLIRGKTSTAFREPFFEGTSPNPSAFALALFSGLWAYGGWDQGEMITLVALYASDGTIIANYVTEEMKDPAKNMPKVIHSSMATVIVRVLTRSVPLR
jgi:amino acid transporter